MHGCVRNHMYFLDETVNSQETELLLAHDALDWTVGDEIAIASTDSHHRRTEYRHISAISGNRILIDKPLEFRHLGKSSTLENRLNREYHQGRF